MIDPQHLPVDPELRALYIAVDLQHAAEAFSKTTIGRYVLRKAAEERTDALADLVDVDAADQNRIRELQTTVKRADSIEMWLAQAILDGQHAHAQLDPAYQQPTQDDTV